MLNNVSILARNTRVVFFSCIFLCILLLFKFIFSPDHTDSKTTTLVNPSYIDKISAVHIIDPQEDSSIRLEFVEDFWRAVYTEKNGQTVFPADEKKILQLIAFLTDKRAVRTVSQRTDAWSHFGLDSDSAIRITVGSIGPVTGARRNNEMLEIFSDLFFGKYDAAGTSVYMRTNKLLSSFSVSSAIRHYTSSSSSFWADSFIISAPYSAAFTQNTLQHITVIKDGVILSSISPANPEFAKRASEICAASSSAIKPVSEKIACGSLYTVIIENGMTDILKISAAKLSDDIFWCAVDDMRFSFIKIISKSTFLLLTGELYD